MCGLLRAKAFTSIPPVGNILVRVPWSDGEFVMTFQRHGLSAAKMVPDLNSTVCLQRERVAQQGSHIILLGILPRGRCTSA